MAITKPTACMHITTPTEIPIIFSYIESFYVLYGGDNDAGYPLQVQVWQWTQPVRPVYI